MQHLSTRLRSLSQHQLFRYALSGGTSFATDQGLFLLLFYMCHINGAISSTISLAIGWTVNYLLSHFFVFRQQAPVSRSVIRYLLLAGFNFAFTTAFIAVTVDYWHAPAILMKPLVGILVIGWTFWAYKHFVFKSKPNATPIA